MLDLLKKTNKHGKYSQLQHLTSLNAEKKTKSNFINCYYNDM